MCPCVCIRTATDRTLHTYRRSLPLACVEVGASHIRAFASDTLFSTIRFIFDSRQTHTHTPTVTQEHQGIPHSKVTALAGHPTHKGRTYKAVNQECRHSSRLTSAHAVTFDTMCASALSPWVHLAHNDAVRPSTTVLLGAIPSPRSSLPHTYRQRTHKNTSRPHTPHAPAT